MMIIFCIRLVACTALWNNYAIIAMVWNSTKMSEEEGEGERQRIFDSLKKVHQWAQQYWCKKGIVKEFMLENTIP